jgi:lipid-A-disaccharide synthase
MKYYIISGERSGDLHASNLIKSLKAIDPEAQFRGMGGEFSANAGLDLCVSYHQIALMGFVEVLLGFRKVLHFLKVIKKDMLAYRPDALILVDFGGFNMKIAKFAKDNQLPVHYYIPPKVWAWNQKRAFKLKAFTDRLYCILPFEPDFFKKFDVDAQYVGNPLFDELKDFTAHPFFYQKNELSYKPIVALLPGSRTQEVRNMLDNLLKIIPNFPQVQFVVAGVNNLDKRLYSKAIEHGVKVIFDQTYDLLAHANAAIVTSGTATLETAIFKVPQIVVYKTSSISYWIGKKLIRVPFISLVNLIAEKALVKELIQEDFNPQSIDQNLRSIFSNGEDRSQILLGYEEIIQKLGTSSASDTTATLIVESFKGSQ